MFDDDDDDEEYDDDSRDDDDEGDDEEAEAEAEDEDEDEVDDPDVLRRVEAAFRSERAVIRACADLQVLRRFRAEYIAELDAGTLTGAGRIRTSDLVEVIDDRITDLKARKLAGRF